MTKTLEEQAIEIAKKEILIKLAEEEPYIFGDEGIYHKVKQLGNGELMLTLRVFDGFVTDVVETTVKRKVYKKKQLTTDQKV